jgi:hypothetical protein
MVSESHVSESAFRWAAMDDDDKELIAAYQDAFGYEIDDADDILETARDAFAGNADSTADFAESMATETGSIPADLPNWLVIDWEATWNCNLRYDYAETYYNGKHWFFYNN